MTKYLSLKDPNSYSNPEECIVKNIYLELAIDFKTKILKGYVDLTVQRNCPDVPLVLDASGLKVHVVRNSSPPYEEYSFDISERLEYYGSQLKIYLPKGNAEKFTLRIEYETSPNASALQWLEPAQTAGKKHPYMFSMSQSIHARSMLPCQDTSFVKTPFSKSIDTDTFMAYLKQYFKDKESILNQVDWDMWLHKPGLPTIKPKYNPSKAKKCEDLAELWLSADDNNLDQFKIEDFSSFTPKQICFFLGILLLKDISIVKLMKLNEAYKIEDRCNNNNIRYHWIRMCLKARWKNIVPDAIEFVKECGINYCLFNIYKELHEWEETKELAVSTFKKHQCEMMHLNAVQIAEVLKIKAEDC